MKGLGLEILGLRQTRVRARARLRVLSKSRYNFTNTPKAYLSAQASLSAFVNCKTQIVSQKLHRRWLNTNVCGSERFFLVKTTMFNNDNSTMV